MRVFAPYFDSLLNYAAQQNIAIDLLNKGLESPHPKANQAEEMLDAEKYLSVFNQLQKATGNPYFGLNYGCYPNMGALGLVLEVSLNTSNIEQGVLILQKFLDSKFPLVSAKIKKDSREFVIELQSPVKDQRLKRHLLDMVLSIIYRELKLMLSPPFTPKIRIPFTESQPYTKALKTDVSKHSRYQIFMPIAVVNTEINKNSIRQIELLLPQFVALLNQDLRNESAFSERVRNMVLQMCSPEIPDFDQIQAQFPYSKRTIQRKLKKEGKSFRDIVNKIKEDLSNYLTNEKHLKTKDVAHILGYSESSAYLHALKSWNKKSSLECMNS